MYPGPVPARVRLHVAGRRAGHLRADHPALRTPGRVEPWPAVGRRHDRGPRRGDVRTQGRADRQPEPAGRGRARRWQGRLVRTRHPRDRGDAGRPGPAARRRSTARSPKLPSRAPRPARCRPAPCSSRTRPANVAALTAAGLDAGVWFERVLTAAKPATTQLDEAPQIAVLVNSAAPTINDTMHSLQRIFGSDARVRLDDRRERTRCRTPATDPLADIDVIYNTGQNYPATVNIAALRPGPRRVGHDGHDPDHGRAQPRGRLDRDGLRCRPWPATTARSR